MIIGEFCDVYPPNLDGVGTVVKSYCEQFSLLGDECYYIAPDSPKYEGDHSFNVLLYKGIKMPTEAYHIGFPVFDFSFQEKQRGIDFDIIHAHSPFIAGNEAFIQARKRDIPLIATFHSKYYDDFYNKTHSSFLASIGTDLVVNFYNRCDEVWTVNEKTVDVLRSYGYKKDIFVIPNGTDLTEIDMRRIYEINERYQLGDSTLMLYVGQMNWKKNLRRTLEAFCSYCQTNTNCRLMMVGQGPDEKEIHEYADNLGISDRIIFTGHIGGRETLMAIYARASLFLFPSLYDTAGLVVKEAAVARTPSIIIRGSCASEGIVDGFNGILCDDTTESMAEAMGRGMTDHKTLGENARETIPTPWERIVKTARDRYEYLIDRYKGQHE